jgi:hypothetical protein
LHLDTADVLPKEDEKEKEKVDNAEEEEVVGIYNERIKVTPFNLGRKNAIKKLILINSVINKKIQTRYINN